MSTTPKGRSAIERPQLEVKVATTPDPITQALTAGVISGIIIALLRISPLWLTTVEPLCLAFNIDPTGLLTDALLAIEKAQAETVAQGYHVSPIDPANPAAPRFFVDACGNRV